MDKKRYVFDMGNVITKPAKIKEVYEQADMKCSYEDFRKYFYHSKESDDVYKGLISDDEFFDYIRRVCGSVKSVSELKELYFSCKGGIYKETIDSIEELKKLGNNVYLLSNLKEIDYDYLNKNINLSLFDKLFLSYQLGMCKPYKDIYEYVIDDLGTNEFYFFDDSISNVNTAQGLGIDAYQTTGDNITKCMSLIRKLRS